MQILRSQSPRRLALEMSDDLSDRPLVLSDDQMHMVRQNRTGMNDITSLSNRLSEPTSNRESLLTTEMNGRKQQSRLGITTSFDIMLTMSNRVPRYHFCGFAEGSKVFSTYKIGTRAARIIWQPKTVGAEGNVMRENHRANLLIPPRKAGSLQ